MTTFQFLNLETSETLREVEFSHDPPPLPPVGARIVLRDGNTTIHGRVDTIGLDMTLGCCVATTYILSLDEVSVVVEIPPPDDK